MKRIALAALLTAAAALAQKHEIGLTLGRIHGPDRAAFQVNHGTALQANYGIRLAGNGKAALWGEVHFLANPQRTVTSRLPNATRDVASLYLTPGLRVKLNPQGRIQPYGVIGGGYALHEHSTLNIGGGPNAAPRSSSTGAFVYGGGVDVPVRRWLALRGEIRDFLTGNPQYNIAVNGRPHNVVAGGGFVLRF